MSKEYRKDVLWMKVTLDEYELPLAVADTSRELERMLGLRKNAVLHQMYKAEKRKGKCSYITVRSEGMKTEQNCKIYSAENIITGEMFRGNAFELADIIGCVPGTVRRYGLLPNPYQKTWEIKIIDRSKYNRMADDCNSLTEEDLKMWDDFIASCRTKKKPKGRFRKPQEII